MRLMYRLPRCMYVYLLFYLFVYVVLDVLYLSECAVCMCIGMHVHLLACMFVVTWYLFDVCTECMNECVNIYDVCVCGKYGTMFLWLCCTWYSLAAAAKCDTGLPIFLLSIWLKHVCYWCFVCMHRCTSMPSCLFENWIVCSGHTHTHTHTHTSRRKKNKNNKHKLTCASGRRVHPVHGSSGRDNTGSSATRAHNCASARVSIHGCLCTSDLWYLSR